MSARLAVFAPSRPAERARTAIPVPLPRPPWATKTEASDGYLMYQGAWVTPATAKDAGLDANLALRLVGADELTQRPDGSIVAQRETEVQIRVNGGQLMFLTVADLPVLIGALSSLYHAAGGGG